ncbi:MAG: single-stranded DNA-binding protein [Chloroflexota bacterium]|nr:single-stranded DNA-binding protein [Chloroflexota bacterium]
MLRVSLLGNLGAEPETRTSQKGSQVTTFRVAVNQLRTDADGQRQESTEWFRIRTMGRLAESCQRLAKGARVLVVGRLEITHYQSRDGEPRMGFDVWADEVINLAGRPAEGDRELVGATARGQASAEDPLDSEDLPF